jgi:hypothetical protein
MGRYESLTYTRTLKKAKGEPATVNVTTRVFHLDGTAIAVQLAVLRAIGTRLVKIHSRVGCTSFRSSSAF